MLVPRGRVVDATMCTHLAGCRMRMLYSTMQERTPGEVSNSPGTCTPHQPSNGQRATMCPEGRAPLPRTSQALASQRSLPRLPSWEPGLAWPEERAVDAHNLWVQTLKLRACGHPELERCMAPALQGPRHTGPDQPDGPYQMGSHPPWPVPAHP